MDGMAREKLRALPPMQALLEIPQAQALAAKHGRPALLEALRDALGAAREALVHGVASETPSAVDMVQAASDRLAAGAMPHMRAVINATGIILHTNLGRAPLAEAAVAAAAAAGAYCNLEYDLNGGSRGSRTAGIEPLLTRLTGAEASLVVNNGAAAVLLALSALAGGGDVVVSRGELVEIGGGFRIPDVIQQGGARLVEVGTTNKTRLSDYERAIGPATRVLLAVHQSNFRVTGFVEATPLAALARLAHARNLLLVHDLGCGALGDIPAAPGEKTVRQSVEAGADVVAFSGDKLLGGPQAGLLAGRAAAIDILRRHPLLRALRADKMCLAALEATLRLHTDGATAHIPALRMLAQGEAELAARAGRLASMLGEEALVVPSTGYAGGGTLPGRTMPSVAVCLTVPDAEACAARLRAQPTPVVGRIASARVWLDMLTVSDGEIPALALAIKASLA